MTTMESDLNGVVACGIFSFKSNVIARELTKEGDKLDYLSKIKSVVN